MQIAGDFEGITRQIAEDFREFRQSRARSVSAENERLYEIGFVLYTALQVYLSQEYGPDSPIVEEELNQFQARIMKRIHWQLSPQAAPGRGWLISAIAELVKREHDQFFWRSGYACIPRMQLCYLLQRRYGNETIDAPDIILQLRSENLLSMDKSGVATKKIKGLGRCLCIDAQRLLQ